MNAKKTLTCRIVFVGLVIGILAPSLIGETLFVDSRNGNDANPGSKGRPLSTIGRAAALVNNSSEKGPTTIKIAPGIYNLTQTVIFENERAYTEKNRLTIETTILPNDPNWKPALMPIILSTEDPGKSNELTETYSLKIKVSHVTIRGLKFLGNPLSNNWHACVERVGQGLDDLLITQCMFVGDKDSFNIYCAAIATGNRFIVDHCIFRNCHASTVYWDGLEAIGGKGCAMRYCIVDGGLISGVWTCQTDKDFEFHHNIITRTQYFWMRKSGDQQTYRLRDSIVASNKYYSGYGNAGGPTGQTGAEVTFEENNIIKTGQLNLVKNKRARNYMHPVPGTLGSDLGAGLFKKSGKN
ncbi:right-handed parallel beta-helix repeat-containing protein [Planctomycetota bacterium]